MAVSNDFLEYVLGQLFDLGDVTARRMFGGVGLFCHRNMFGLIADDVVYLKVDKTNRGKFLEAGSSPLKPFPNRPTVLSYFEIPADILEDPDILIEWAEESLDIQKKRNNLKK